MAGNPGIVSLALSEKKESSVQREQVMKKGTSAVFPPCLRERTILTWQE